MAEAARLDKKFAAKTSANALHPPLDVVCEMFLQEQLDQLRTLFVNLDDFGARAIFTDVNNLDHAFERLLGEKIAFEMQCLANDQRTGANDQHAAVTHVLHDARKALGSRCQCAPAGDCGP